VQKRTNFIVRGKNSGFACENCGAHVAPHDSSVRNHCNECLWSKHVDQEVPGDRQQQCAGLMKPVGLSKHRKGYQITHQCQSCGHEQRCVAAPDDKTDQLVELAANKAQDQDLA
jgi:hypothetical protein